MLQFSSQPPMESTRSAFRLVRTPSKGKLALFITSDSLLGCWTHFFGGRTVPCTGDKCEACQALASTRWHGYVAALEVKTAEPVVFEITGGGAEQLAAYRAKHGTLRPGQTSSPHESARGPTPGSGSRCDRSTWHTSTCRSPSTFKLHSVISGAFP